MGTLYKYRRNGQRSAAGFFESTLHVSPDQQLSALQPLTK
jgi:hypothetical protein